jgi:ATP-dependent protease ClpP protease subunit
LLAFSTASIATPIELTEENSFPFIGPVDAFSVDEFAIALASLRAKNSGDIYVLMHSNGGYLEAGLQLIKLMETDKKLHVVVVWAASAAAAMSQNTGGQVFIVPKGKLLFHEVKIQLPISIISESMAKRINLDLQANNAKFSQVCNKRMKLPSYSKRVKDKDWILSAEDAETFRAAKIQQFKCSDKIKSYKITVPTFDFISGVPTDTPICDLLQ